MTRSKSNNLSSFVTSPTSLNVKDTRRRAVALWRELSQQRKTSSGVGSNGRTLWENASYQFTFWLAAFGLMISLLLMLWVVR
jgi:hypothetical protein